MLCAPNQPRRLERPRRAARRRRRAGSCAQRSAISGVAERPARRAPATCRSTAVFRPLKLKSARCSSAFSKPGGRTPTGPGVRSLCVILKRGRSRRDRCRPCDRRSIDRPARVAEAEQLGHLVVGLPRRVVARAAEQVGTRRRRGTQIQAGVAARDDQHDRRQRQRRRCAGPATRCGRRGGGRRRAAGRATAPAPWRTDTPTSSEPTRPGPCVTATASRSRQPTPASASARSTHAADVADVLARRRARARRRPTRGGSRPARRRRSSGRATGVPASPVSSTTAAAVSSQERLDAEDQHGGSSTSADADPARAGGRLRVARTAARSDSSCTARARCRVSVMIAGDVARRRDVEGGVADPGAVRREPRRPDVRDLARRCAPRSGCRSPSGVVEIDRRERRRDVERDAVLLGQHRHAVGADLVGDVAVGGDAIGADDDEVDRALAHQRAGHVVGDDRRVDAVLAPAPTRSAARPGGTAASRRRAPRPSCPPRRRRGSRRARCRSRRSPARRRCSA